MFFLQRLLGFSDASKQEDGFQQDKQGKDNKTSTDPEDDDNRVNLEDLGNSDEFDVSPVSQQSSNTYSGKFGFIMKAVVTIFVAGVAFFTYRQARKFAGDLSIAKSSVLPGNEVSLLSHLSDNFKDDFGLAEVLDNFNDDFESWPDNLERLKLLDEFSMFDEYRNGDVSENYGGYPSIDTDNIIDTNFEEATKKDVDELDNPIPFNAQNNLKSKDSRSIFSAENINTILDIFPINSYTTSNQERPMVASLNDGTYMVVWDDNEKDGDSYGVFGRCFNFAQNKMGEEFQVNEYIALRQRFPSVSGVLEKHFLVTWESENQDTDNFGVFGRVYNSNCSAKSDEFQINSNISLAQGHPVIGRKGREGFVIAWEDYSQGWVNGNVMARCFNATYFPLDKEFQVNTYTSGQQVSPAIHDLDDKGFVVVWSSKDQDGSGWGFYGQCYNVECNRVGSEFRVNNNTVNIQGKASVSSVSNDTFMVVWHGYDSVAYKYGIYARIFNYSCYALGNEEQVNTYTNVDQQMPLVRKISEGRPLVVWHSDNTVERAVYGRIYNVKENALIAFTDQFTISASASFNPSATNLPNGTFLVVWQGSDANGYGIFGRYSTPLLINHRMNVTEGETFVVGPKNLLVSSMWAGNESLRIFVENVTHGFFDSIDDVGNFLNNFTQRDILDGKIRFTHDDSEEASSLNVYAVDPNGCKTQELPVQVDFKLVNDNVPQIVNRTIMLKNGDIIVLTPEMISAKDLDKDCDNELLTIHVSEVAYGRFEREGKPGISIDSFTQKEVASGKIKFIHDGSANPPSFYVDVSDGKWESQPCKAQVNFTSINNYVPKMINNQMAVYKNTPVNVTEANIKATDEDNSDDALTFSITGVRGQFEDINDKGNPIFSFPQWKIGRGEIRFVPYGSEKPVVYVDVTDGEKSTGPLLMNVTFHNVNHDDRDDADDGNDVESVGRFFYEAIVIPVFVLGFCLSGTGAGILIMAGIICVLKQQKQVKEQQNELKEIENAIGLDDYPDLKSKKVRNVTISWKDSLGHGASAAVYKGIWINEGGAQQKVAIKLFTGINKNHLEDIQREFNIMLNSEHSNIVQLHGICIKNGSLGLVMEYMNMGTLSSVIKKGVTEKKNHGGSEGLLTWSFKWKIAYCLANALQFLHGKKIAHRDIKPDNVLLHKEGEELNVKLSDFGISKKANPDQSMTMEIGTYRYMAPELVNMELVKNTSSASYFPQGLADIYAYGMTIVALINEEEPYGDELDSRSIPQGVFKLGNQKNIIVSCPASFFNLVTKCHDVNPENRPNAQTIVKELENMETEVCGFRNE